MLAQIFRDQENPLLAANECFQRGPLGLELLLAILFFPFDDFLEFRIDLGQLGFAQAQLGNAAFVVDWDSRLVDDGLRVVVDRGHVQLLATSLHTNLRGDLNLIL